MIRDSIGFIGFGKMAEAIWKGLSKSELANNNKTYFYEINKNRSEQIENSYKINPIELIPLISKCKIIFICIKPQGISTLVSSFPKEINLSDKLIISILAGTTIKNYEKHLGKSIQLIRIMPNTPSLLNAGMSAIAYNNNVTAHNKSLCKNIFSSFGEIIEIQETDMNTVTGISGSGPAFFYRLADAIAKTGEKEGLEYSKAIYLAAQTMIGAGTMLLKSNKTPQELISDVSSPNGTTIAGLTEFDKSNIDQEIQNVILTTIKKAKELSREN
jgi:pyrroline-5-carboxylate reductase